MKHWIIGLAVIFLIFFAYSIFNGTPWGKEAMKEESAKYLQEKYGDKMEIESVEYDFDNSSYFIYRYYTVVHLKRDPQIQFKLSKYDGKMVDNYFLSYWEYEVKNEIKQQFHQISSVSFLLRSNPLENLSEGNRINPPSYHEIKGEIKDEDSSDLRLWINVNEDIQDNIMNTLLEIVLFLKEKEYKLSAIQFKFENQIHTSYYLNSADLKDIIDHDSLINKLK
ncbi:hypothetical protein J41TS12_45030 [Paenibacillus antibioticophila]|uniref:YfjL-like N-terminal domain-containing protein n=1 Tax=Paenibacillus antibioticophila TaxID=1274374 RepID=A0A920CK63_9BACL|nr:hypothetical protein [Paenibacillus antibioticophila]GIO39642.1 hypothetical protein J41TS12_45030 [Paenibacillus antibioticophila]